MTHDYVYPDVETVTNTPRASRRAALAVIKSDLRTILNELYHEREYARLWREINTGEMSDPQIMVERLSTACSTAKNVSAQFNARLDELFYSGGERE